MNKFYVYLVVQDSIRKELGRNTIVKTWKAIQILFCQSKRNQHQTLTKVVNLVRKRKIVASLIKTRLLSLGWAVKKYTLPGHKVWVRGVNPLARTRMTMSTLTMWARTTIMRLRIHINHILIKVVVEGVVTVEKKRRNTYCPNRQKIPTWVDNQILSIICLLANRASLPTHVNSRAIAVTPLGAVVGEVLIRIHHTIIINNQIITIINI